MKILRQLAKKIKLLIFENLHSCKHNIQLDHAVFSFTFDDAPASAMVNGARILEQVGAAGTFYIALGICDAEENKDKFVTRNDIHKLQDKGHDIECHTFSHLNIRENPASKVLSDCHRNTSELANLTGKSCIEHFAYPFGAVSLSGKKILRNQYKTLRTTNPGLNYGITDMTHLRTISLCNIDFDRNQVRNAINEAVNKKAWVIFFSHDIQEQPSKWGLSPEDFAWVVNECINSPGKLLDIKRAYDLIIGKKKSY